MKAIAAIMLMVAVACTAGCNKPDDTNDPNNEGNGDGGNGSDTELPTGMYLGIIGFNDDLHVLPITRLNEQSIGEDTTFINNLKMSDATLLIEAVNTSLDMISSNGIPKDLINVSIVNFTDGMDEGSYWYSNNTHGTHYSGYHDYLEVVTQRIRTEKVTEIPIEAHTIGILGNDVQNVDLFRDILNGISSLSIDGNVYVHFVTDFSEVQADFKEIAENLHQTSINSILTMRFPAPNANDRIRFTFDSIDDVSQSHHYIEGVFILGSDGKGVLTNVQYVGMSSSSGNTVTANSEGTSKIVFKFEGMKDSGNNNFTTNSIKHVKKWTYNTDNNTWVHNSEWVSSGNTNVDNKYYSSLIILNLDCSLSLGEQAFKELKTIAKEFVNVLKTDN
jgi:hypothetical protein